MIELTKVDFKIHQCTKTESYMYIADHNPYEVIDKILKNQEIVKRLKAKIEWWSNQPEAWFSDKEWSTSQFYEELKETHQCDES